MAIAVYNAQDDNYLQLRLSGNTPIHAAELTAIQCAISWLIKKSPYNLRAFIFTDCLAALTSMKTHKSKSHSTIVHNILHSIHQFFLQKKVTLRIAHIFAHIEVSHNEAVDAAANITRLRPTIILHILIDIRDIRRYIIQNTQLQWHKQYTEHILTRDLRPTLATLISRYTNQQIKRNKSAYKNRASAISG